MIGISDIEWAVVPMVVCWAMVVYGLSRFVFASFAADEIRARVGMRYSDQFRELAKRRWELKHGYHFNEEMIQSNTIREKGVPLGDDMPATQRAIRAGMRRTLPARMANYLLACGFCQSCEMAAIVFLATRPMSCWWPDFVPTTIMYGAAVAICRERLGGVRRGLKPGT